MSRLLAMLLLVTLIPVAASADEIVRYQLADWKAKHIHDNSKADVIEKTLKSLGCEIKKSQHNGHVDIRYRCPNWREMSFDTHDDAHRWEKWLKEFQFKTVHKH